MIAETISKDEKSLPMVPSGFYTIRHRLTATYYKQRWLLRWNAQGYHFGLRCCLGLSIAVLLANVSFLIISEVGVLPNSNYETIRQYDQWLLLLINILDTLLLGASNYCMQCLAAPTRQDVDAAHSCRIWLDIGIPSIRNLVMIPRSRRFLWLTLGVSTVPLQLLYSSTIFSTLSNQQYAAFLVRDSLSRISGTIDDASVKTLDFGVCSEAYSDYKTYHAITNWLDICPDTNINANPSSSVDGMTHRARILLSNLSSLRKLTIKDCVAVYNSALDIKYGDVFVVGRNKSKMDTSGSPIYWSLNDDPFRNKSYDVQCHRGLLCAKPANKWTESFPGDQYEFSHCLAQTLQSRCELQVEWAFLASVILCNSIKILCITCMIWTFEDAPLITPGDAIESFLDNPDSKTMIQSLNGRVTYLQRHYDWHAQTTMYSSTRRYWFSAVSKTSWIALYIPGCLALIIIVPISLKVYFSSRPSGLGELKAEFLISSDSKYVQNLMGGILLANGPQLFLSLAYLAINGILTNMLVAKEWSEYAHTRNPLRVTSPKGSQLSTYRLQVPYRFGVPLLACAALLHWSLSQSIFLVRIQGYAFDGSRNTEIDVNACAYSPPAILLTVWLYAALVLSILVFAVRRFKPGIPVVGSCSAAIGAACHPPAAEGKIATRCLMWGVVSSGDTESEENGVSHCSFSSSQVQLPKEGKFYACSEMISRWAAGSLSASCKEVRFHLLEIAKQET